MKSLLLSEHIRNATAGSISIPAHFEFAFPRLDVFRSGNSISSFCRTGHCHFATLPSPTLDTNDTLIHYRLTSRQPTRQQWLNDKVLAIRGNAIIFWPEMDIVHVS